jgi:predicted MFS family arabinose efflux permease
MAGAFFNTVSKALMGDLTEEPLRYRMFSARYVLANIGYSIGPILGAYLGIGGGFATFLLTGGAYLAYAGIVAILLKKFAVEDGTSSEKVSAAQVLSVVRKDSVLALFLLGGTLLTTVHGEMSVTLSQYLEDNFEDGMKLFGLAMSVNGVAVICLQAAVTRRAERFTLFQRIAAGSVLFALGEIGFAFSAGWAAIIGSMIVFTIGEMLIVPAEYAALDRISPHGMRGTYYGAQSVCELGNFFGPWAGGLLLSSFGGTTMFLAMAAVSLVSGSRDNRQPDSVNAAISPKLMPVSFRL